MEKDRLAQLGEPGSRQQGSALIVCLVMMLAIGALVTAHLSKVMGEARKTRTRMAAERALAVAEGELERAKNIVNAAPYIANKNSALSAAVLSNPPYIPGTSVEVIKVGGSTAEWFVLRATGRFRGIAKSAQIMVKERSPLSAYNFFVTDHPLGISGAPRGAIHSNKTIDFYFPYGLYRDQVTASEGFNFKAGANTSNTKLLGPWDPHAAKSNIMDDVKLSDLASKAKHLSVTDDLIAEVEFQGKHVKVDLFKPKHDVAVKTTEWKEVFTGTYEKVPYDVETKHYKDEPRDVTEDIMTKTPYEVEVDKNYYKYIDVKKSEMVDVYEDVEEEYTVKEPITKTEDVVEDVKTKVWVEDPPPAPHEIEGGFAVGGKEPELGHWEWITTKKTVKKTVVIGHKDVKKKKWVKKFVKKELKEWTEKEKVLDYVGKVKKTKHKWVKTGEKTYTVYDKVYTHSTWETKHYDKPIYKMEEVPVTKYVTVPEAKVDSKCVTAEGVLYFEKAVRKVSGKVEGQVSLVSNTSVMITGSLQYVDKNGETRMLNGLDPTKKYEFNPSYTGESVLGIMSKGDITYSKDTPQNLEINASMISKEGKVAYEGISLSLDGTEVSVDTDVLGVGAIKNSIRRVGGIVAKKRPVTTYVDAKNEVLAGFKKGISFMDRNMLLKNGGNVSPPYVFQMNIPTWTMPSTGRVYMPK